MRKAGQDYRIIIMGENFIGFSLGYDFCAEHEWGYDDIKRNFGIPEIVKKTLGIKSRTISRFPTNIVFKKETYKKEKFALLYTSPNWNTTEEALKYIPHDLQNYKKDILWRVNFETKEKRKDIKDPILTAWDSGGFGVGVMGEENIKYLEELYNAIQNKNLTIAYMNSSPNNPFSNASLSLLITNKIPQEFVNQMYNVDKEHYDRVRYEKKIGLTKLKEKTRGKSFDNLYGHNHGYYIACSAKWIDYEDKENRKAKKKEHNTKYDIMYWVNYSDDDNTHGYFTVEEVKAWLKGKKKLSEIRKENDVKYGSN